MDPHLVHYGKLFKIFTRIQPYYEQYRHYYSLLTVVHLHSHVLWSGGNHTDKEVGILQITVVDSIRPTPVLRPPRR